MRHIIPDKILHGQDQARLGSKDILHGLNPDSAERLRPKEGIDVARGVEVHAPPWHTHAAGNASLFLDPVSVR